MKEAIDSDSFKPDYRWLLFMQALKFRNLNIELSSACNFDCAYCPEHQMTRKKQLMDYDLAIRLLSEVKEMGLTEEINFYHMGETLLHRRAVDIFRHAKDLGLRIKLNTNGSRLTPEMRRQLLELNIDKLYISYHSSYVRWNRYATFKAPISFEKWHEQILATVEDRYKYNSKSHVVVILFRSANALKAEQTQDVRVLESDQEVEDALHVWLDLGQRLAKEYDLPYLYDKDTGNFLKRSFHSIVQRADKLFPVLPGFSLNLVKVHTWNNDIVCSSMKKQQVVRKAKFGGCDALSDSMAIFADGSYSLCCADWDGRVVVGNAKNEPLRQFLESDRAQFVRNSFKKGKLPFEYCKQCRGGYTTKSWLFNQVHSYIYYNSEMYRHFRRLLNMQ
jgi:organic radical activating enzyme